MQVGINVRENRSRRMCNPNTENAGHKTQNKTITQKTKISNTDPKCSRMARHPSCKWQATSRS